MRKLKHLVAAAALGSALFAVPALMSGCGPAVTTGVGATVTVGVGTPMPAWPYYYTIPRPRPGYVWVHGHWTRPYNRWLWRDGYWLRHRPGLYWHQPHWAMRGNRYVFIGGRWSAVRPIYPRGYFPRHFRID